ncbi:MAG: acyl-CoA dehydrogenase [Pseudonocardiaceae bacterium]|nr:acyl-CoA dehydrogenase [Pseudonocardiaceae bacterium]
MNEHSGISDHATELAEMVRSVLGDHLDDSTAGLDAEFDPALWSVLEETGLTLLSTPESAGGSGGGPADAAVLLSEAGGYAAPVPLAETDLLAGWLLAESGLPVSTGPLTAVAGELSLRRSAGRVAVAGSLDRVPWARHARTVAVLVPGPDGGELVVALPAGSCSVTEGSNLAREPRDGVEVDTELPADAVGPAPQGAGRELALRGALARALQLCGAAERALELMVRHAGEREQFGRPIARFQAVTQQIALAAGEVAACRAATDAAVRSVADGFAAEATALAVGIAKSRTSAAAGTVAAIAHQVHGAMGFTLEHRLRLVTTRMWAWREEYGNEAHWDGVIGAAALAAGPEGVWRMITGGAGH